MEYALQAFAGTVDFKVNTVTGEAFISQRKAAELLGVSHVAVANHVASYHPNYLNDNGLSPEILQQVTTHYALYSKAANDKSRAFAEVLMQAGAKAFIYHQAGVQINAAPQPQFNLPTTYLDALKCLVAETEAHNETKAVVKQATHHLTTAVNILEQALPKASAFDTAVGSGEHMLISEAAKFIGVGQVALFGWLESNGWIFRRGNNGKWQAYAGKISGGLMAHRFTDGFDVRGDKHTACTALITPRGALVVKALMQ